MMTDIDDPQNFISSKSYHSELYIQIENAWGNCGDTHNYSVAAKLLKHKNWSPPKIPPLMQGRV